MTQSRRARWRRDADVVVVGSGAAGTSAALSAAMPGLRVLMVTKDLIGGATPLAQGGLAAAIGPLDSVEAHAEDTLTAGAGLCEPSVVTALASGAPGAIKWLAGLGARLETWELRLEGGHSARRIVHSGDDATGAEVHRALLAALLASGVEILDRTAAIDLILSGSGATDPDTRPTKSAEAGLAQVAGLVAAEIGPEGRLVPGVITAQAVVIAAGGLGQAFATTSNPAGATGDGIAIAARAGAVLRDLEFVQFHPTVLWLPGASGQCPLITEALRGAGAVLRDLDGKPLMAGHHPRGDLAPRDVVAARMAEVIAAGTAGHVWLDATRLGRELLENGFPTVTAACRKYGIDPVTEYIPVAPGAHYSCGGIRADLDGRTSIPGLYAVGEAASTGVQGANRLASNSVTEAIIAGRRAGQSIADLTAGARTNPPPTPPTPVQRLSPMPSTPVQRLSSTPSTPIEPVDGVGDRSGAEHGIQRPSAEHGVARSDAERRAGRSSAEHGVGRSGTEHGGGRSGTEHGGGRSGTEHGSGRPGTEHGVGRSGAEHGGGRSSAERGGGRRELAGAMSLYAGVMRDSGGLVELVRMISEGGGEPSAVRGAARLVGTGQETGEGSESGGSVLNDDLDLDLDLETLEAANLRVVSALITAGALLRAESRGCHRRRDAAEAAERPWHTLTRWDGRDLVVTKEEL